MKLVATLLIASALVALPACSDKPAVTGDGKNSVNDALDNRPAEPVRDAAEDIGDAAKDAGTAVKDAAVELKDEVKEEVNEAKQ
jgi:hypothetical protein